MSNMVTIDQAAQALKISRNSLYRLIKKRQIVTYKKTGDLKTYLRAQDVTSLSGFQPRVDKRVLIRE